MQICLSPDGHKVALSSASGLGVDVWDVNSGALLYGLPEAKGAIWRLVWSSDSQRLAVTRSSGELGIWNLTECGRVLSTVGL
jgi:WD40 repeat protein